jgi:hypothetical protein
MVCNPKGQSRPVLGLFYLRFCYPEFSRYCDVAPGSSRVHLGRSWLLDDAVSSELVDVWRPCRVVEVDWCEGDVEEDHEEGMV